MSEAATIEVEGTRNARFSNQQLMPLEDSDIARMCPAVFATAPRNDVSNRYGFVSSADILASMRASGFVPTHVMSYHRRNGELRQFTKHMLRFRKAGNLKKQTVGDVVPQLIMVNSHDRSSQFEFYGGLMRLVCENGMMVSEGARVEPIVLRHTTSMIEGLSEVTGKIIEAQGHVFEHINEMRGTTLTEAQAIDFATHALALRPERAGTIDPRQLLNHRRSEDEGMDLWRIFNRVQENMIKGGQTGITASNRAIVTRGTNAINADIQINSGMWRVAMDAIAKARESSSKATRGSKAPA